MHRLHNACKAGDLMLVITLASETDQLNALDDNGQTPISHAARRGYLNILTYLIERGATVSGESDQDLSNNIIYQVCQCMNFERQRIMLQWLFNNNSKLHFTDGTERYHIQLALNLLINHESSLLKKEIFNRPNDRLAAWIKAKFYINLANASLLIDNGNSGSEYLKSAIDHYENYDPRSDQELRDYATCLQSLLICDRDFTSLEKKLAMIRKIFMASDMLKNKLDSDYIVQSFNTFNLAESHRVADKKQLAKDYYLQALAPILSISAKSALIYDKVPDYFHGIAECFHEKSAERAFFTMATKCFLPGATVKDELFEHANNLINQPFFSIILCKGSIALFSLLIHTYNNGLLKNRELLKHLNNTPNAKEDMKNIHNSLREKLINYQSVRDSSRFFITPSKTNDTMMDNLPAENLEVTHWSTHRS